MVYQFVFFIAIIQSVIFLIHWFLYKTLVSFFSLSNTGFILPLKIILGLLSISLISATFLSFQYLNVLVRLFYIAVASWMGFLNFLFLASISLWIIYFSAQKFSFSLDQKLSAIIFFGLAIIVGIYGIVNAKTPRIVEISVKLPNLPEYWRNKTAVWVSDIHLGSVRRYDFAKDIADRINQEKPDIVFIGGDLFDGGTIDLDAFTEPFSKISAPDGIYFITGNHEKFFSDVAYLKVVKEAGIKILNNELVNIKGLQIIGVDWNDNQDIKKYKSVLDKINLDKNLPSILLKHAPTNLELARDKGISFQISGHTHEGQIFPINLITKLIYRGYEYGFKKLGDLQIYTSSGAGTWGPPMRVAASPEIVVIKFK